MSTDKVTEKQLLDAYRDAVSFPDVVRRAVEQGVSPRFRIDRWELSSWAIALSTWAEDPAVKEAALDLVRWLVARGSDLTSTFLEWSHSAAECSAVIRMALECGFDVRRQYDQNQTALHLIEIISEVKATPDEFERYVSLLMETMRLMISAGADINARDYSGRTPLHMAAEAETSSIYKVTALLRCGAAPDTHSNSGGNVLVDCVNEPSGRNDKLEQLLKYAMDKNIRNQDMDTALHRALEFADWWETARYLVELGLDMEALNGQGLTAFGKLVLATAYRSPDRVPHYHKPATEEIHKQYMEMIEFMLSKGANPRAMIGVEVRERLVDRVMRASYLPQDVRDYFERFVSSGNEQDEPDGEHWGSS